MKSEPDSSDEVHELSTFQDPSRNHITPVALFEAAVAQSVVGALASVVRRAHNSPAATAPDCDGIVRAQTFEEGDVYMLEKPFEGYFADRYLMDFYDVKDRDICSRMHFHTGLRFVRMMTGIDTVIRVSSLVPFIIHEHNGADESDASAAIQLERFEDELPSDGPDDADVRTRYNVVVPQNCWVDMQVPRGVSHQFNAIGPNAVIDSVHPEESIETFRENMSGYKMMAQTIFLAKDKPDSSTCVLP